MMNCWFCGFFCAMLLSQLKDEEYGGATISIILAIANLIVVLLELEK